jgi:ADP-dependent NAD(P)H-hydrate dehydratase
VAEPTVLSADVLAARWPPGSDDETDSKHDRGTVLIVGDRVETPGALLLAGQAAMRAGAGRLELVVPEAVAVGLAVAIPESGVAGVALEPDGGFGPAALKRLAELVAEADAVLVGSGTQEPETAHRLLETSVAALSDDAALVIDAAALPALGKHPAAIDGVRERAVVMPNPGELEGLLDGQVDVHEDPVGALRRAIEALHCTVAIRASESWIGDGGDEVFVERDGCVGLATSGSGDVLAGLLAGFLARGADPLAATLWAVHTHALTGRRCTAEHGPVNFLARDLLDAVAAVLRSLTT